MAGKHQGFFRSNDPSHDWVTAVKPYKENVVEENAVAWQWERNWGDKGTGLLSRP
jgi:hypothetical protein